MKNMVLFLDSNVLMDYLCKREPNYKFASCLMDICKGSNVQAYIAFHTLPSIWYILRKPYKEYRRELLLRITKFLTVVSVPHEEVVAALKNSNFYDFEDCLQEKCAVAVNADYIVTENIKDFTTSTIPVVTIVDILRILYQSDSEKA